MKIRLWGTRGSLPASFSQDKLREKLVGTLMAAQGQSFDSQKAIEEFVDHKLDRTLSSTCGTNTCNIEIEYKENEFILCDAGTGIRDFSYEFYKTDPKRVGTFHLFMSHLHWDHIQGFPFFGPIYHKGNRVIIHSYHQKTQQVFKNQMSSPCFPVDFKQLGAEVIFDIKTPGSPFELDGMKVIGIQQYHPGLSYGYKFENKEGKKVVYSTDCEHTEKAHEEGYPFVDFYKDADVLIFDAMYSLTDASVNKAEWGHSSNIMGVKLAARAKAKHLIIFHHEAIRSDFELEDFFVHTKKYSDLYNKERNIPHGYPEKISLAYDGMIIVA
ncbi:MAG: hypothetical protein A2007_06510 [Verrucomicrobia bacterium GWC2_42_7]|nr:MAG: hypothetical protein A2007_06510 [Verrucomicrobia bacterium GWC2_42_7]